MALRAGERWLFLSEHTGDASPDTLIYLHVEDVDGVADAFGTEAADMPWGMREVHLTDPAGNRVRAAGASSRCRSAVDICPHRDRDPAPAGGGGRLRVRSDNATAWYENIASVDGDAAAARVGSRMASSHSSSAGGRLHLRGPRVVPGERFVMSTAEGPFPMETTYTWDDAARRRPG